jgi:uncharacterized protein
MRNFIKTTGRGLKQLKHNRARYGDFFERHGFAVTISLDGIGSAHDRQRPFKNGAPSFAKIIARVEPLLARQRRMQVSARVTVTPSNLDLVGTLEGLIDLGFHSVGFAPMLSSPTKSGEMDGASLGIMPARMIDCGERFEDHVIGEQTMRLLAI